MLSVPLRKTSVWLEYEARLVEECGIRALRELDKESEAETPVPLEHPSARAAASVPTVSTPDLSQRQLAAPSPVPATAFPGRRTDRDSSRLASQMQNASSESDPWRDARGHGPSKVTRELGSGVDMAQSQQDVVAKSQLSETARASAGWDAIGSMGQVMWSWFPLPGDGGARTAAEALVEDELRAAESRT